MHGFFSCPTNPRRDALGDCLAGGGVASRKIRRGRTTRTWWASAGCRPGPANGGIRLDILQDMGTSQLIDHVPSLGDRVVHTRAVGTCTITSFECSQD